MRLAERLHRATGPMSKHKPIGEQVIVVIGATSGIGVVAARMAAARGAKVVLSARDEEDLSRLVDQIEADGGAARPVLCDAISRDDMERVAGEAVDAFGGIDTWVSNAGVSIYGRLEEVAEEAHRTLFELNFWSVVNGCLAVLPHLRRRGGALVNIGSVLSDRAFPVQAMYLASKRAVAGFSDSLRTELQEEGAPISVSLIKPAAVHTSFAGEPAPVFEAESVARAILRCAEEGDRELYVGAAGEMIAAGAAPSSGAPEQLMAVAASEPRTRGNAGGVGGSSRLYGSDLYVNDHHHDERLGLGARIKPIVLSPMTAGALLLGSVAVGTILGSRRG